MSKQRSTLVVQVAPRYPPHLGGMENVAETLAQALAHDRQVLVLTSRSGPTAAPRLEVKSDLTIRRLATFEVAQVPLMPSLFFHLVRLPRRAIVHVHIAQAYVPEMVWLASVARRRPFIAHFHLDVEPSGRLGPIFVWYKRNVLPRTLRAAARVIALSSDQAAFLTHTYGIAESKISVVPNGVREEFFIGSEARADSHTGPARLLFVGRLSPQKNLPRLLSAMAKISVDAELTIVGDGEERVALEKLQADLGLDNVRFVGRLTGPALIAWYRWADVFVLPSDKEGMPLVLLEAMAAALPIIATNVPGIRDTVGSDGVLVDPNPSALAAAIDRVVEDAVLRAQLAQGSFRRSQTLAWSDVIDQIKSVYADVSIQ